MRSPSNFANPAYLRAALGGDFPVSAASPHNGSYFGKFREQKKRGVCGRCIEERPRARSAALTTKGIARRRVNFADEMVL